MKPYEGTCEGAKVGVLDGAPVGANEGLLVGETVGSRVEVGEAVIFIVGVREGEPVN